MRFERWIFALLTSLAALSAARADGDGLVARTETVPWSAPAKTTTTPSALRPALRIGLGTGGIKLPSFSVLGDLYWAGGGLSARQPASGFRATSGLLVGARTQPWGAAPLAPAPQFGERRSAAPTLPYTIAEAAAESATVPYVGFGYSALSVKSGWSFNADLGVMSLNPSGAIRFGRAGSGNQGIDDLVRDMRLSPVLQLGVSYTF